MLWPLPLLLGAALLPGPRALPDAPTSITLFDDFGCPSAPPMTLNSDGTWTATQARKDRLDCGITRAQVKLDFYDGKPAKQAPDPGFQLQLSHGVVAVVTAVLALATAMVQNRTSRHCRALVGAC